MPTCLPTHHAPHTPHLPCFPHLAVQVVLVHGSQHAVHDALAAKGHGTQHVSVALRSRGGRKQKRLGKGAAEEVSWGEQ
jgi:hypothetical protein